MSKAAFYRLPIKSKTVYRPRRRQRVAAEPPIDEGRQAALVTERQPAYHPAPQFRRNRRFWLRRLGLDKAPR